MRGDDVVDAGPFGVAQVLGLLPERPARLIEDLAPAVGTATRELAPFAHFVPELATHEVAGVARPLDGVKSVRAHDGLGQRLVTVRAIQGAPSALTWVIAWVLSSPSRSK